jgi:hypothetical protein
LRRSTRLLIAFVIVAAVAIAAGLILVFSGETTGSSSPVPSRSKKVWSPLRPKPPSAVELQAFLRANGQHPTSCAVRASRVVCLLAHRAGRCEQDADGSGSCTYRRTSTGKQITAHLLLWTTSTASTTVTVTGSDHR